MGWRLGVVVARGEGKADGDRLGVGRRLVWGKGEALGAFPLGVLGSTGGGRA